MQKKSPKGDFIFYEGPPTANAKPALHHLEARAFKDVIPRYKTMKGYRVDRRAGWDTHGLPVELQIEKKLGLQSKKEIEKYGIDKFNKECKESVFQYINDWELFTDRIGYWIDKKRAYYTFDTSYIESLWNIVGNIDRKKLLYKDYKVVPWCPRCGTALSSHELAQGYEDVKDLSVYVKFKVLSNVSRFIKSSGRKAQPDINKSSNVFVLAWTTTPWTLPGNVALAVGENIDYVKVKLEEDELILAKERLSVLGQEYRVIEEFKGSDLIGVEYEPLYPYLKSLNKGDEKLKNAYKVYGADFVTTTDGTGVVHTAVMYGQDDFELGTKVGLPKFHLVDETGHFIEGMETLSGLPVKDKEDNGLKTSIEILRYLQANNLFFKKENYEHTYPHCWRCKTPLIYYARDSWYIAISKLKDKLINENKEINWEPPHIKEGRFGEWLREIKDWAISRERYWGTPLPVWISSDGEKIIVDSLDTLKKYSKKSNNNYFVIRHGEARHNLTMTVSIDKNADDGLTEKGINQVKESLKLLEKNNIDLIISSPFKRARETVYLISEKIKSEVFYDERLGEMSIPSYAGKAWTDYHKDFPKTVENFDLAKEGDESYLDVKRRVFEVLSECEKKYKDKNILFVTHGAPGWLMLAASSGFSPDDSLEMIRNKENFHHFKNAEIKKLRLESVPRNDRCEVDLHRPYIDDVILYENGKEFKRVKEVMDVWFDSGAMPFAQDHYPFEKKRGFLSKLFGKDRLKYPADFISEAIDQTRGWFYTLHAVGVLMGKGKAYKNVICLGHLLDAQGKKMSKSVGNIVEPWEQMEKYGVDAIRFWMYSVNQPGESKNYDEKNVLEISRKVFSLLDNVYSFYELYRDKKIEKDNLETSNNVLDRWIRQKLSELNMNVTKSLDSFNLFESTRDIKDFIDNLSTWYLRRSRERIKAGDIEAKKTLYFVLKNMSKIMAPFTPFFAEDLYQKLKNKDESESVHLEAWPEFSEKIDSNLMINMEKVAEVCTVGNFLRKKENIPVKQPLSKIKVKNLGLSEEYLEIIKDELNLKEIIEDSSIKEEAQLDTKITEELKKEGEYRELVRIIQDKRKELGLLPVNQIRVYISKNGIDLIESNNKEHFKSIVGAKEIIEKNEGENVNIGGGDICIKIEKNA